MEKKDGAPFKIGVMDSGMGGLSVLRHLCTLPFEVEYLYYGDLANSPYGEKSTEEVLRLTLSVCRSLLEKGASAILIACNTATSAAAADLRKELSVPVFGMEPAIKPALLAHPGEKIALLATSVTHREEKLRNLKSSLDAEGRILHLECDGLASAVDRGDAQRTRDFVRTILDVPKKEGVRGLVLGCTHYVFLKKQILSIYPKADLYDGNEGTVRHLVASLELERFPGSPTSRIHFSGVSEGDIAYSFAKKLLDSREENFP